MIEQITSKIMLGGINKYADIFEAKQKDVQIRITNGVQDDVNYEICEKWQPKKSVSFKDILNKKIDILGYEQLATPFLSKSLLLYEKEFKCEKDVISIFLFSQNNRISVAVFNETKNVKLLTLEKHFQQIGF